MQRPVCCCHDLQPENAPMPAVFRVMSYNIHKGVSGLGPARRLEIHNLRQAIGERMSDHLPLVAEFVLPGHGPS